MIFNRTTLTAGVFAGLGTALWTLFEYSMGWHGPKIEIGATSGYVGILFPLVAIVWALRRTRANDGGRLTVGRSLGVGLAVAVILSVIGVVFYEVYYTKINPTFLDRLANGGPRPDTMSQLLTVVVGSVGFSLVVALVAGLLMARKRS